MTRDKSHVTYRVPYADTDKMGVVYYANYLVYFERARNQCLIDRGLPYREMEERGFFLPVSEAHVRYRQPAGYDDVLDLYAWVDWTKGARIRMACEIRRDADLLAEGHTVHGVLDSNTWKPVRVPIELRLNPED